ncbi:M60 family metallopeptidase [Listeria floridensis]|nr:M60 family metallopeptidase [Listeria floridensis]
MLVLCFWITPVSKEASAAEPSNTFVIQGNGKLIEEKNRLQRIRTVSELTPTQFYVKKGDRLTYKVSGGDGTPSRALIAIGTGGTSSGIIKNRTTYDTQQTLTADRDGVVSLINEQPSSQLTFEIISGGSRMPFFRLGETTNAEFTNQMKQYSASPYVQLVSKYASITVSYASAAKYLTNPQALMTYYDQFLEAQDRIEGISVTGRNDYAAIASGRYYHYVEASSGYMYATNEYMGFSGDAALRRLLGVTDKTSATELGWGIWHETGHQRQLNAMTWGQGVEVTVNIYSLASEKAISGSYGRLHDSYPNIQKYLATDDSTKDYDAQDNFVKFGMFGQLMEVFGDEFFPQLHQKYRLLGSAPYNDATKKQTLIVQTSELAQVNLIPFFKKWGIVADSATEQALTNLPELTQPIWLNTDKVKYRLELPQKKIYS